MENLKNKIEIIKADLESQIKEVNKSIKEFKEQGDYEEALYCLNDKIMLTGFLGQIKTLLI